MHDETLSTGVYLPDRAQEIAAAVGPRPNEVPLEFHGTAGEYFRIWIINLALSIVTLGVYSAWATVRTRRYFYANTRLAGAPFEYTARPLPILRGRLLAVALFGSYVLGGQFSKPLQAAAAMLIGLLMPWLIVRGLAFRARYSSWRGLPFRFEPDTAGAYKWYFAVYLLMPLTLGLIYPYIKANQQRWMVENHRYGSAAFRFSPAIGRYYGVFFATLGVAFAWLLVVGLLVAVLVSTVHMGSPTAKAPPAWLPFAFIAVYLPAYLGIYAFFRMRMLNLLYSQADLACHRFRSTLRYWPMYWIYLGNTLAILLTLGMAVPWAMVRMARYRAACLALQPAGDLDIFVAETLAQGDVSAAGAEMDGMFSIDIGL